MNQLRPRRAIQAGFTLIELLAVMLIIAILATFLVPKIPFVRNRAYITACRANLSSIGSGLLEYQTRFGQLPSESGARFHCALIIDEVWENTPQNAKGLTCPAVPPNALAGLQGLTEEEWYAEGEAVDGSYSAYAGRNMADYAFKRRVISGKEVLVADDNDGGQNHTSTTLALMGDNSVREFDLVVLRKQKVIGDDVLELLVGPESPVEELTKLSLD